MPLNIEPLSLAHKLLVGSLKMKIKYLSSCILALVSHASFADFSVLDQQVKYFNDWSVACNNQRECFMDSLPPKTAPKPTEAPKTEDDTEEPEDFNSLYLSVSRKAEAESAIELSINDWDDEGGSLEQGETVKLKIDQQSFDLGKVSAEATENASFKLDSKKTAEILAALQKATQAEISTGDQNLPINLQGFNDGLQYFDEQQQRVNTPTALVKKGEQAFTATPPQSVSITPVISNDDELISDEDRVKLQEKIHQIVLVKDCLATANKEEPYSDVLEILDKEHYLIGVTCAADELNRQTLVLVAPKDKPEQAELASFDQGVDKALIIGEFNGYSASEGILLNYYRKNEMGDCGSTAEWAWNGKSFVLTSYYSMPECRGSLSAMNVWKLDIKQAKD